MRRGQRQSGKNDPFAEPFHTVELLLSERVNELEVNPDQKVKTSQMHFLQRIDLFLKRKTHKRHGADMAAESMGRALRGDT